MNAKDERQKERESLAARLDRHADEEDKILTEYRQMVSTAGEGPVSFLMDLILTDEEFHHFLFRTMAKWLTEPSKRGELLTGDREEFVRQGQTLWKHEEETINECGALRSRFQSELAEPTEALLFDALLGVMISDSEKHQRLLSVVEKMIKGA